MNEKLLLRDLELDLWESCNLKCAQCTHAAPFFTDDDERYTYENLEHDLTVLNRLAKIANMRVVGGEPLLNKNLLSFLKMMKKMDMAVRIVMFTNGLLLKSVDPEIFKYIDRLRITVYPLHESLREKIKDNIKYVKEKFPDMNIAANEMNYFKEFHTVVKNEDEESVKKIYQNCYYAYENEGLSSFNGRLYRCYAARKKYNYLKAHDSVVKGDYEYLKANTHDSIELNDSLTRDQLVTFLTRKDPLEACKWCLGCSGASIPNRQLKKGEPDIGSLDKVDFKAGKSYVSNCLLSWCLQTGDYEYLEDNEYFSSQYIKDFSKQFTTKKFDK